jgi:hypothetical protein
MNASLDPGELETPAVVVIDERALFGDAGDQRAGDRFEIAAE